MKNKIGIVKWFNDGKGYGFLEIKGDPEKRDIFVHYTAIMNDLFKTLSEGETVEFELVQGPKGDQAVNVRKVPV